MLVTTTIENIKHMTIYTFENKILVASILRHILKNKLFSPNTHTTPLSSLLLNTQNRHRHRHRRHHHHRPPPLSSDPTTTHQTKP
ncbi:hypothetical protein QVD17_38389 [Tagetes erecta]|uniref:Uncharacterized protein n=1 Tax=Tagetes erecta TaxID=13708 RepID=A0AAD8JQE2_TARER|nr:hypothetical protein QVD17_38389 [Tagetes erecta]